MLNGGVLSMFSLKAGPMRTEKPKPPSRGFGFMAYFLEHRSVRSIAAISVCLFDLCAARQHEHVISCISKNTSILYILQIRLSSHFASRSIRSSKSSKSLRMMYTFATCRWHGFPPKHQHTMMIICCPPCLCVSSWISAGLPRKAGS